MSQPPEYPGRQRFKRVAAAAGSDAYQGAFEAIGSVLIGCAFGYWADSYWDTAPVGLLIGVVVGYGLNPITPIIKRISTSSFVIVSGGWTFLTLAFSYWLIDIKKRQKWSRFLSVVGMNPLFIYLFAHVGGAVFIEFILLPFYCLDGWAL